ncbi:hypothetical protein C2845_PM07G11150 [Panicum miliaceum]|uniref:Uncharacterized protein n=1 Tax=Panicum miliaceum TaxID=4540 RepID=A0A3L6SK10_PANMI|nr:hypothetical protein C2845_PM07G11150 [Panicum miliaceum]
MDENDLILLSAQQLNPCCSVLAARGLTARRRMPACPRADSMTAAACRRAAPAAEHVPETSYEQNKVDKSSSEGTCAHLAPANLKHELNRGLAAPVPVPASARASPTPRPSGGAGGRHPAGHRRLLAQERREEGREGRSKERGENR